jgi:hypothetical protein
MRYNDDYISFRTRCAPSTAAPVISIFESGDYQVGVRLPAGSVHEPTTWVTYYSVASPYEDIDHHDNDYYPVIFPKKTRWDWIPSLRWETIKCKVTYSPSLSEETEEESIVVEKDKKGGWKVIHIFSGFKSKKPKKPADIKNPIDAEIHGPKELAEPIDNEHPVDVEIRRRMKNSRGSSFMGFFICGRGRSPSSSIDIPREKQPDDAYIDNNTLSHCYADGYYPDELKNPVKEGFFSRTLGRFQISRRRSSSPGKKADLKGKGIGY